MIPIEVELDNKEKVELICFRVDSENVVIFGRNCPYDNVSKLD